MKLVVGLGNIGEEYAKTNHNVGFMVLDRLAEEFGFTFKNRGCDSDYAEFKNETDKFIIAKPRTYMNESGRAVKSLMKKFNIKILLCPHLSQHHALQLLPAHLELPFQLLLPALCAPQLPWYHPSWGLQHPCQCGQLQLVLRGLLQWQ